MLHQFGLFASEPFLSTLKALGHFWHLKSKRRHQQHYINQIIMLKYIKINISKVWVKYEILFERNEYFYPANVYNVTKDF